MNKPNYHTVIALSRTGTSDTERDAVILAVARTIDRLAPLLEAARMNLERKLDAARRAENTAHAVAHNERSWQDAGGPDAAERVAVLETRLLLVRALLGDVPADAMRDHVITLEGLLTTLSHAVSQVGAGEEVR